MIGFPIFPDVPNVPGVPPVMRYAGGPSVTSFIGSTAGNILTVGTMSGAQTIFSGAVLSGAGIVTGTGILSQSAGIPGGSGTYLLDTVQQTMDNIEMQSDFIPPDIDLPDDITEDDPSVSAGRPDGVKWGVFKADGNTPVILGDSTIEVEFVTTNRISDFPVGPQGFASYNKVITPYSFRMVFAQKGPVAEIDAFLKKVDGIVNSNDTYSCVTPGAVYANANAIHYDYRRNSQNGVAMIAVHIYFEEVRKVTTVALQEPKLEKKDNGPINPVPVASKPAPLAGNVARDVTSISATATNIPTVPLETPAAQAAGPKFGARWSTASGDPLANSKLNPSTGLPTDQNGSATLFKLDPVKKGDLISYNASTGAAGRVLPGQAPFSRGVA